RNAGSGSQPPICSCARHISDSTADAWRPSGYFAIWALAHSRFSGVKAKPSGCSTARRRTLIRSLLLFLAAVGPSRREALLAVNGTGGNRVQLLTHIGFQRAKANRG